jgi:hypothetical protein
LPRLWRIAAPEAWRLLRVLLVRLDCLSAGSGRTLLRAWLLILRMLQRGIRAEIRI